MVNPLSYNFLHRLLSTLPRLSLLLLACSSSVLAGQIQVSVDRNPVSLNDSFQLLFSSTDSVDGAPDFSPLQQDFEVLSQRKGSESNFINGSLSSIVKWSLTVMPKRSGQLTIPAIAFGDDLSKPLSLSVSEPADISGQVKPDLFLEVSLSSKQVYVQAQLIYTLQLYQRVELTKASLSELSFEHAVVEPLAGEKVFNRQLNGINYRVTELKYAIFPQQSGNLEIKPMQLTAEVISRGSSQMNSFFNRQRTQTKRIISKGFNVKVLAIPAAFKGQHWLPAESLTLSESWSNADLSVEVGEPITRTISLTAQGLTASKLPEINMLDNKQGLKIYPDKALLNDQKSNLGIQASRVQKIAIIPALAEPTRTEAIEIPWFNTLTHTVELAVLPAKTLTVKAAAISETNPLNGQANKQPSERVDRVAAKTGDISPIWRYLTVLFALAWLISSYLLYKARATPKVRKAIKPANLSAQKHLQAIQAACRANDPQQTLQATLKWGKDSFNCAGIKDIIAMSDAPFTAQIELLQKHLYAKKPAGNWSGEAFQAAFTANLLTQAKPVKKDELLEPLYPA